VEAMSAAESVEIASASAENECDLPSNLWQFDRKHDFLNHQSCFFFA
jgi:DNA polymerase IIIc chi subunit